jgi:hypothetical protein
MWRTVLADTYGTISHTIDEETVEGLPRAGSCPFDPNDGLGPASDVLQGAAYGSLKELRTVRGAMMRKAFDSGLSHPFAMGHAMQLVLIARLCAAHRLPEDARCLAAALCFTNDTLRHLGFTEVADDVAGELVAVLERLAEAGDEYCAIASAYMVGAHPAAAAIAHALMQEKL